MAIDELRAFLDRVACEAPGPVRVRTRVSGRGDIRSVQAVHPVPTEFAAVELPGDVLRDVAGLVEACERGDLPDDYELYQSADGEYLWALVSLLADECLRLARLEYGDTLHRWLAWLREGGSWMDEAAGPRDS